MTDEEWNRWAATYAREQRPVPPVLARARTDRRRAILGMAGVYVLAAGLALAAARELLHARTAADIASNLILLVLVVALAAGVGLAMRGAFGHAGGTPLELLADLERRHARRRRLIRFMPWLTGAAVAGTLATEVAQMAAAGRFDPASAAGTLATCAATVGFVWLIATRVGRLIERELRAAAEARRLLAEGDEESCSEDPGWTRSC
jgi:hypothetical protein